MPYQYQRAGLGAGPRRPIPTTSTGMGGTGGGGAGGLPTPTNISGGSVSAPTQLGSTFKKFQPTPRSGTAASGGGQLPGASQQTAGAVAQAGTGLLDPQSDYFQRLMDGMKSRLGKESAAKQRSAALRAAQSGFGGGASPELMAAQRDIGVGGLEAMGEAGANLRLAAPQLGGQLALGGGRLQLGGEQLGERARQFDVGLAEGGRQFDVGMGQRQTEFGGTQGMQAAGMQQQYDIFQQQQAQQQRQFDDQMQFAMEQLYGGRGGGAGLFG